MPTPRTRKSSSPPPQRTDWTVLERVKLAAHRTELAPGVEFSVVRRVSGGRTYTMRLTFRRYVTSSSSGSSWIDAWDGRQLRSVDPAKVAKVHRTRRISTRSIDARAAT